ncbi:hypothetical protein [Pedobacter sp. UBA5917]|jgi:hypothetical protein|uniref:hypothetical protein n=1 Tax=Pedobacter sp. UBA5917 TaxID=1947061 RepID=UPI0025FFAB3F|nr:hypothetical protein [Pedobacter sp. UBA5917]
MTNKKHINLKSNYKKFFYLFLFVLLIAAYFQTALSSMFSDSLASKDLRKELSGSWVLVSHNQYAKTAFIGGDGSTISFSKYFLSTKNNFLPKQYKINYISYMMGGKLIEYQAAIILSNSRKYDEWMMNGYAISSISNDTLKMVSTSMIIGSAKPSIYTFKKVHEK